MRLPPSHYNTVLQRIIPQIAAAGISSVLLLAVAVVGAAQSHADPQDDRFLEALDHQQIPAIDGIPALIKRAHQICDQLHDGMPFGEVSDQQEHSTYENDPTLRIVPWRVTRTAQRFVVASVEAYCPANRSAIPPGLDTIG